MSSFLKVSGMLAAGAAGLAIMAGSAWAGPTLDAVKARDKILCGIPPSSAGFAAPDDKGVIRGLDADVCRAVSAAIFGDSEKIEFVSLNTNVRFQALQAGEVDILSRQTTLTFSRDNSLGLNFGPVVFYDGQGVMVPAKLGVKSALELGGAAVCILPGTTTQQNLTDYFRTHNIQYESVVFENSDEWRNAFFSGRCDVLTSDRSDLASTRAVANNPEEYVVLPETISKEPLAPVVRHGDDQWLDILTWSVHALVFAEEKGITQANVDSFLTSEDPEILRFLGKDGELGAQLGLPNEWAYNIIKLVGNYGEVFDRNLGPNTKLGLSRGINEQWTKGGLLYAPPFR